MSLTIRPLNSGYIPTKPLEYWYHFSCKKYVEKMGITNESDQLPDMTFLIEGGDQLILVDTESERLFSRAFLPLQSNSRTVSSEIPSSLRTFA